ncbi:PKD domain-containing protein [Geoglobus ahangari]
MRTIGELYPRTNRHVQAIDLSNYVPAEGLRVRLYWTENHEIEFVGLDTSENGRIAISEAPLVRAEHSNGINVTEKLRTENSIYSQLRPGERITLYFEIPEMKGAVRDLILVVDGFYTRYPAEFTGDGVGTRNVDGGTQFIPMLLSYDGIKAVKWDFGDGTTSTSFVAFHKYEKQGVYNGTLTVYYRNGEKKVLTFYGGSP